MDYGYIYLTTNMLNGVSYIGMSRSPVFNPKYFGSGVHLKNALRKNGKKRSPCSEETKKKISEGNKKANHSERWTSEMREAQRRRFCINVLKRGESE